MQATTDDSILAVMGEKVRTFPDLSIIFKCYAEQLGKTPNELTTAEKQQAFMNYVLSDEETETESEV